MIRCQIYQTLTDKTEYPKYARIIHDNLSLFVGNVAFEISFLGSYLTPKNPLWDGKSINMLVGYKLDIPALMEKLENLPQQTAKSSTRLRR